MEFVPTAIPEVVLIKPQVFADARGHFFESWSEHKFAAAGLNLKFVQDNQNRSERHVLRGLHYQLTQPQGKLVRVVTGAVFDVAVDLRRSSPTFGRWVGAQLTQDNHHMLWVPPGFAHGFMVLSESVHFLYKCTQFYAPEDERAIRWDDVDIGVEWPLPEGVAPVISTRDAAARTFRDAEYYPLKVLVTGAQGQVGQSLVMSAPPGITVVGLKRAELDVGDAEAVHRAVATHRPAVIINAAAYTGVDRAETEFTAAHRVNGLGPRHLAQAAGACGARLLHISTDFVFDGHASVPYVPEFPTAPLGVYGLTKLEGEQAVRELLPGASVVLRTAWVYAAHGANFLRTMLRVMGEGRQVRVVADQVGTPTAADALAGVLWSLAQRSDITGVHHFTDAGVASWYDFAVAIAEEATTLGLLPPGVQVTPIGTADYPTPARRPGYSVLDKRALLAVLGLEPRHWRVNLRAVLGVM